MIRAAIVGLGWWGRNLVNAVREHGQLIRFTAAHTRHPEPVAGFCAEHGLAGSATSTRCWRTRQWTRWCWLRRTARMPAQVVRAAAAGNPCSWKSRSPSASPTPARRSPRAERAGVVLAVGFNRRFHPSMARLRQAVRDGRLGTIVTVLSEQSALHGLHLTGGCLALDPSGDAGRAP